MSKQTLKFGNIVVNKKEFCASKQAIALNSVNTNKIVISYKIKHNDSGFKYFIGYLYDNNVIKPSFNNMINTLFSGDEIPKERNHYVCIAAICIDSVLRVDKKNYSQVYLEQCKYKMKKRKLVDFIDDQVDQVIQMI